jgi:hypothetical protein
MQPFLDLGRRIDYAWETANFNERSFPNIAAEALAAEHVPELVSGDDVLKWVLEAKVLPAQEDLRASFGQPPITVYRGRRYHIQVLYWLDGSTTIHRHGFCGAFQVLEGSSLHSRWEFSERKRISTRMLVGQAKLLRVELLRRGNIVEISHDLTHGLFHLEAPSATIVVRTDGDTSDGPQYEYHPPTIALDPFFVDPLLERHLQVLQLLYASNHSAWEQRALDLFSSCDIHTTFRALHQFIRNGVGRSQIEKLAEAAHPRYGEIVDEILRALNEVSRRRGLHLLRRQIRQPEGRLFLALLQNLPNRDAILQILQEQYPEITPQATLQRLVTQFAEQVGVDTSGDLERILVDCLLGDVSESGTLDKLREVFDDASIEAQMSEIQEQISRIRNSLLAPLFVRGVK